MVKRFIKLTVYEDAAAEFRWRASHGNGKIIADSAEGYKTRGNALRAAKAFVNAIAAGPVIVEEGGK